MGVAYGCEPYGPLLNLRHSLMAGMAVCTGAARLSDASPAAAARSTAAPASTEHGSNRLCTQANRYTPTGSSCSGSWQQVRALVKQAWTPADDQGQLELSRDEQARYAAAFSRCIAESGRSAMDTGGGTAGEMEGGHAEIRGGEGDDY